jgi:hypothetical protein
VLNYDQSVEKVAELMGEECDTAIETWLERGELEWAQSGLRLLKLHGSIDWVAEQTQESGWLERPAVVFGEAGKLRSEGPYLGPRFCLVPETACEEFNRFLDRAVVVGSLENREMGFFRGLA